MEQPNGTQEVRIPGLLSELDRGSRLLLLDVRNEEEFKSWKLEGRQPVDTLHIPYFNFIEDEAASLARLPQDGREVVVVCAQGDSSDMVAEMLREAGYRAKNVVGGMVAYGDYLEPVKVPLRPEEAGRFELWQMNRRGKGCLSYIVRAKDEAIVIDASRHLERYEALVKELGARIVRVLDTHVHADHVSGGPELAARNRVPYFVAAGGEFHLKQKVQPVKDGERIQLGGASGVSVEFRAVATPGHTPGSTSYLIGDRYLLSGDTLFVKSVGRPDLGGQVEAWGRALFHTLRDKLAALADETVILPAHYAEVSEIGPEGVVSGRLGDLRRTVPELQITNEEGFVAAMRAAVGKPPESYSQIIGVNLGLAAVSPEKITEWELGKNQCAASARHRQS
jgi:glyoxylase-like metal-dependent hydrolase (beta-lactamase superfamily II)